MRSITDVGVDRKYVGFIGLVKELAGYSNFAYFPVGEGVLSEQHLIQNKSYEFIKSAFTHIADPIRANAILIFVTKIDVTELDLGGIDLSSPSLQKKEFAGEEAQKIFEQNATALTYLLTPFSERIYSKEFSDSLDDLIHTLDNTFDVEEKSGFIVDFMTHEKTIIDEVLLFSQILNLICVSQSLFAFSYQLKQGLNFAKLLEIILTNETFFEANEVSILAQRYSNIFTGTLAARVFCQDTLETIESAFKQTEVSL